MPRKKLDEGKEKDTPALVQKRTRNTDALFEVVRQLALEEQRDSAQDFISLRSAARKFEVPLSSMTAVYRRLTQEGLLSTVRGSRTVLQGRNANRTITVRAFVGMPLSLPRLQTFHGYREGYLALRLELQTRGFAVSPIYFNQADIPADEVAQKARAEKIDIVVWLRPHGLIHDSMLRLRDAGIRFVGLNIGGVVGGYCRYEIRRRQAISLILHEWGSAKKFNAAVLVRAGKEALGESERLARLRDLARLHGFRFEIASVQAGRVSRLMKSLGEKKRSGILLAASAAAILGSRAEDTVAEVFTGCRIALIDGPIEFPFAGPPAESCADVVVVDWARIARRIAQDIMTGEAFAPAETVAFEANAHLQVSLSSLKDLTTKPEHAAA
jgi:hypothetical protein